MAEHGTILAFIKFNNFGTRHWPRRLFHSFCCTTWCIFEPLYEPGFNTDKYSISIILYWSCEEMGQARNTSDLFKICCWHNLCYKLHALHFCIKTLICIFLQHALNKAEIIHSFNNIALILLLYYELLLQLPYVGKFCRGRNLVNLANRKPFANLYPPIISFISLDIYTYIYIYIYIHSTMLHYSKNFPLALTSNMILPTHNLQIQCFVKWPKNLFK